jgi:hypothetical protein
VIEITHFRLSADADEREFLRADKYLQEEFAYTQPGLLRRTAARTDGGDWIVIDLWRSKEEADECGLRWDTDPAVQRFMSFVDRQTFATQRYATID